MATTYNPALGEIQGNGTNDPFVGPPTYAPRYASLDIDQFSSYSSHSPTQARRALEAHLKDTDRRIQDASRLGTSLLQQRKDLTARLADIEQVQSDNDITPELRSRGGKSSGSLRNCAERAGTRSGRGAVVDALQLCPADRPSDAGWTRTRLRESARGCMLGV